MSPKGTAFFYDPSTRHEKREPAKGGQKTRAKPSFALLRFGRAKKYTRAGVLLCALLGVH